MNQREKIVKEMRSLRGNALVTNDISKYCVCNKNDLSVSIEGFLNL